MNLTTEQLLFSSALDVRHRFVRLYSILRQAAGAAGPSEQRVIDSLADYVRQGILEYATAVADVKEAADTLGWNGTIKRALAEQSATFYGTFRARHDEAFTYISTQVSVPDDLRHFLFRALDLSLVSQSHAEAVALYPSRHLMWESASSRGEGSAPDVAAILVPYSETRSPMRWPLLVHELAHHISPGGGKSDAQRAEVGSSTQDKLDDALSEMQADAIAEDAIGFAYPLALAREGHLIVESDHSRSGGPTIEQRLRQLHFGPEVAANLPREWHVDGTRIDLDRALPDSTEADTVVDDLEADNAEDGRPLTTAELAKLSGRAEKLGAGRSRPSRSDKTERALRLMEVGDPIPAVPRLNSHSQAEFETVARGDPVDESLIESLFLATADIPLTDAEILEAAWVQELSRPQDEVIEDLVRTPDEKVLDEEVARLDALDVQLSRSLQAAAVHRWLLDNDEKARDLAPVDNEATPETDAINAIDAHPLTESSPLSDVQLARRLTLPPGHNRRLVVRPIVSPAQVGGTTIDLRLGTEWETLNTSRFRTLDPSDDPVQLNDLLNESVQEFRLTSAESQGIVLHPGELLLALTLEYLSLPTDLWGQLEGRSTWARVGLQVHATAGMVDAGFQGFLTLELQNTGRIPIVLYPGLRVGQMAFFPVDGIARPYNSKPGAAYSNQAKVRTAFGKQPEHKARHSFLERERQAEMLRRTTSTVRDDE